VGSLIGAALARAQGFLLEPPVEAEPPPAAPLLAVVEDFAAVQVAAVQVVVTGLSRGSGATTIAAGLAHALAVPGARSAHLLTLRPEARAARRAPPGVVAWELPPAMRLPREIADYGATLARLAEGGQKAAVVWDVRADEVACAAGVMEACDAIVCVATGSAEPALCSLVCDMLAERHGRVLLVANRVRDDEAWSGRCSVAVPEARFAALLLGLGRAPRGAVGEALARVAALTLALPYTDKPECRRGHGE
jgi:hypothetical protein